MVKDMGSVLVTRLGTKLIYIIPLLSATLLNGCFSVSHHDGPPHFYVDEKKIPNAVPKIEPLSRIGNKRYYTVFGKRYNVMRTSYRYDEVGTASWYGTMFHARRTSNGELYNMLAMTAAHKTLPLPTYVRVTNLKNNKFVIVKVNDRGPFLGNRLIDLSYVAAKKLDMLGHGTTVVRVTSIDPRDALEHPEYLAQKHTITSVTVATNHHYRVPHHLVVPHYSPRQYTVTRTRITSQGPHRITQPVVASKHKVTVKTKVVAVHKGHRSRSLTDIEAHALRYSSSDVYIQVAAFHHRDYAQRLKKRLLTYTKSPIHINPSKSLYRVQIGPIKDMATATRLSLRLKSNGIHIQKMSRKDDRIVNDFDMT